MLVAAAVMAAALTTAVAGCSTPQKGPDAARQAREVRALTDAEQLGISDAEQRLIKRCMNGHGFQFWEAERLSLEESRTIGYVDDDVDWARRHGYGSRIEAKMERARKANANVAYRKSLSAERRAAYDIALDGGPDAPVISANIPGGGTIRKRVGGCVVRAEKQLYGDVAAWFRAEKTVMNLRPLYVPQVMRDKTFTTALKAWARCMKRAGYPYPDPEAARQAARQQAQGAPPDQAFGAERQLAVADATCARDTSLRAIGSARETFYVNKLRDRYGEALDTSRLIQREALARAMTIVGPRA
ncbi:hypothetical protein ABT301_37160 [Streptomyces sp. NPDC000987]|uniref:hypothetical protein n=1 Tax=Streptomyces sp. NPDC000987 TaxID=3154374 RepID=UPI003318078D